MTAAPGIPFVLLHGSLLGPWSWDAVALELLAAGHRVIAPELPYGDGRARSAEHVAAIESAIAEAGGIGDEPPTFVAHSLAGLLAPALGERFPGARIIYVAALLPWPGRSLLDQLELEPGIFVPEWARIDAPPAWEDAERARLFLFHDAAPVVADAAIARLVPDSPALAFEPAPLRFDRMWPSYVLPTGDRTIDPDWMRRATSERLQTRPFVIDTGHCPQIARPELLAETLLTLALPRGPAARRAA